MSNQDTCLIRTVQGRHLVVLIRQVALYIIFPVQDTCMSTYRVIYSHFWQYCQCNNSVTVLTGLLHWYNCSMGEDEMCKKVDLQVFCTKFYPHHMNCYYDGQIWIIIMTSDIHAFATKWYYITFRFFLWNPNTFNFINIFVGRHYLHYILLVTSFIISALHINQFIDLLHCVWYMNFKFCLYYYCI